MVITFGQACKKCAEKNVSELSYEFLDKWYEEEYNRIGDLLLRVMQHGPTSNTGKQMHSDMKHSHCGELCEFCQGK